MPPLGTSQKRPTVGRLCDLPWVASTTYSRFFRRPTVGRFLPLGKALQKRAGGGTKFRPDDREIYAPICRNGISVLSLHPKIMKELVHQGERVD